MQTELIIGGVGLLLLCSVCVGACFQLCYQHLFPFPPLSLSLSLPLSLSFLSMFGFRVPRAYGCHVAM